MNSLVRQRRERLTWFDCKIRLGPYLFPSSSPYLHCGTNSSALYNLSAAGVKKDGKILKGGGGSLLLFFSPSPTIAFLRLGHSLDLVHNWNSPIDHRWREILFQNHNKILESDWLLLKHCLLKNRCRISSRLLRKLIRTGESFHEKETTAPLFLAQSHTSFRV